MRSFSRPVIMYISASLFTLTPILFIELLFVFSVLNFSTNVPAQLEIWQNLKYGLYLYKIVSQSVPKVLSSSSVIISLIIVNPLSIVSSNTFLYRRQYFISSSVQSLFFQWWTVFWIFYFIFLSFLFDYVLMETILICNLW